MCHVDIHAPAPEEDGDLDDSPGDGGSQLVTCITVATELAWWIRYTCCSSHEYYILYLSFILFCCFRSMCNGRRNEMNPNGKCDNDTMGEESDEPLSQWQKRQLKNKGKAKKGDEYVVPCLAEEGDGFYLAVFGTYPDVFFAARSVFMQLLGAVSARKLQLADRETLHAEDISSTATSKAEIETERLTKGNQAIAYDADGK